MNDRSRTYNQPRRSNSQANNKILCTVCYVYCSSQLFSTNYCSKHRTRRICDTCVHQHVVSRLNTCLTKFISCPELNCRANLSSSVICDLLLKYENNDLLKDYLYAKQRPEKSEEWIKRFTLRCPGCNVPTEKIGGCNHMNCTQCGLDFDWSKAKIYGENNKETNHQSFQVILEIIFIFIFFEVFFYLI